MGDPFLVSVWDLKNHSREKVKLKCDYCGKEFETTWSIYKRTHVNTNKDCCNNPYCGTEKYKETSMKKYGVNYPRQLKEVQDKAKKTNLEKYGVENPFASEQIKAKIYQTNLEKYGVKIPSQNPVIANKARQTCMERYGVSNYGALYSKTHRKELSPVWKPDTEYERAERATYEYREWRFNVFSRDKFTCKNCGNHNFKGNGETVILTAHHIKNWKDNPNDRYDVTNGITLCEPCHLLFHSIYGKNNNTREQLEEFLNLTKDKKIC